MKKITVLLLISLIASPLAIAKKPSSSSHWQDGNAGHQLGCLIISLLGWQGCEKPRNEKNGK